MLKLYFRESDDPYLTDKRYFGVVEEDLRPPRDVRVVTIVNQHCEVVGGVYYDSDQEGIQDVDRLYIEPEMPGLEFELNFRNNEDTDRYYESWNINSTSSNSSAYLSLHRSENVLSPTHDSYDWWVNIAITNPHDPCGESSPSEPGEGNVY